VTEERMYCREGHNQPASDGGNNVLVGESGRLMMGTNAQSIYQNNNRCCCIHLRNIYWHHQLVGKGVGGHHLGVQG
jgi:hypothetical protein